jgi:FMN phosphatase YigB (HAD superfamily)
VIAWLDDVLYPVHMYRAGACRVGARLLRRFIGIDADEHLAASYMPGREEYAVRQVLAHCMGDCDDRLVRKVAEAMAVHTPQVAPYEDALETFGILQALGVPLWLIGEGPPRTQRLIAERLGVERLFRGVAYSDPSQDQYEWHDSLMLLELAAGASAETTALVCADPIRVAALAQQGRRVFHLYRQTSTASRPVPHANIIPMLNLYDLPEALGLVNWNSG